MQKLSCTIYSVHLDVYIRNCTLSHTHITGVGKHGFTSRDLQQAFSCKGSAIVFYTELVEKMGALKLLVVLKSAGKQVSREHHWFHPSHEGLFFTVKLSSQLVR